MDRRNAAEYGFLLLTSKLGNPERKPLTVAQFRELFIRSEQMKRKELSRDVEIHDLDIMDKGAVEELLGVTDDDVDNLSSYPRTVEGVCMAATLRQSKTGDTKISVRAVPGYDAAAVCARFGGGGHKGAAGATTSLPLEEAAKAVKAAMLEM